MRNLEIIMNLLSWLVLAIVLYALAPVLCKLLVLANGLHHLFGT